MSYDRTTGYFVVDNSVGVIKRAVVHTRGVTPKRADGGKVEVSEGILSFTTMPK